MCKAACLCLPVWMGAEGLLLQAKAGGLRICRPCVSMLLHDGKAWVSIFSELLGSWLLRGVRVLQLLMARSLSG